MGQSAAQPIIDLAIKAKNTVERYLGDSSTSPAGKPDAAYRDSMVKKANDSFRTAAEKSRQKPAVKRKKARSKGR